VVGSDRARLTSGSVRARAGRIPGGVWRYYAGFTIGRLSGLVVIPIASRVLGTAGFGKFEAAFALFLASTIVLDAGLGAALVRFVGDKSYDTDALLQAAARIQVFASLGAIVLLGVPLLLFDMPDHRPFLVVGALVVYAFNEGFAVLGGGLLRASGRDGLYAAFSLVRLVLTAGAGAAGALLLGASGTLLGVAFGGSGFSAYALYRLRAGKPSGSVDARQAMMLYGLPLMATSVMAWTLSVSDRLFLRADVAPTTLGLYSANYRLGNLVLVFVAGPLGLTWIPAARRARDERALDRARRTWALRFSAASILAVLMILAAGPALIPLIFGSGFHFDRTIIAAVGLSGWFGGLYYLAATPALLAQDTRRLAVMALVCVGFNLVANAILIPSFGAHGAAVATLISYAFVCMAVMLVGPLRAQRWLVDARLLATLAAGVGAVAIAATGGPAATVMTLGVGIAIAGVLIHKVRRWSRGISKPRVSSAQASSGPASEG
jgi:O-antigen/teichoic acid export membrane protein